LKEAFEQAFKQMGGTVTTVQAYTGGDQDFSAQLTTIRQTEPDVIFVPGTTPMPATSRSRCASSD
jgi:branched-chain amino acid transport system substrate-binding protein